MPITLKSKRDRITAALTTDKIYIEAYAPVETGNDQEREEFYEDVEMVTREYKQAYPNHAIIVMGDMNAHICGYYSEETNENGQLLLDFCKKQAFSLVPYQGPTFERGDTKTAVDYILLEREHFHKLRSADILSRQYVHSDHNIL